MQKWFLRPWSKKYVKVRTKLLECIYSSQGGFVKKFRFCKESRFRSHAITTHQREREKAGSSTAGADRSSPRIKTPVVIWILKSKISVTYGSLIANAELQISNLLKLKNVNDRLDFSSDFNEYRKILVCRALWKLLQIIIFQINGIALYLQIQKKFTGKCKHIWRLARDPMPVKEEEIGRDYY